MSLREKRPRLVQSLLHHARQRSHGREAEGQPHVNLLREDDPLHSQHHDLEALLGGEGKDWVLGGDERRPFGVAPDCERVRVVSGSLEEVLEQEQSFFESIPPTVARFSGTFFEVQLAPDTTGGAGGP